MDLLHTVWTLGLVAHVVMAGLSAPEPGAGIDQQSDGAGSYDHQEHVGHSRP